MRPLPDADHPLVRAVPDDLRADVLSALKAMPKHYKVGNTDITARKRWSSVLTKAGFEEFAGANRYARSIQEPSTWNARQRTVATLFAEVPGLNLDKLPLYVSNSIQRQTLGLEPKGPLFERFDKKTTFLDALRALEGSKRKALINKLPLERQLIMLCEFCISGECDDDEVASLLPPLWSKLKGEGKKWAPAFADRLISFFDDPRGGEIRTFYGPKLRATLALTVLLALVRAKIPLDPKWDRLFTVWHFEQQPVAWEIIAALPEDRREFAVTKLAEGSDTNTIDVWAPVFLKNYPYASTAKFIESQLHHAKKPRELLKLLKTTSSIPKFTFAKLKSVTRQQLAAATKLYGDELTDVETFAVKDVKGVHVFDALFYEVDSGTFFEKGKTKVVAQRLQFDVQSKDKALAMGLKQALADL